MHKLRKLRRLGKNKAPLDADVPRAGVVMSSPTSPAAITRVISPTQTQQGEHVAKGTSSVLSTAGPHSLGNANETSTSREATTKIERDTTRQQTSSISRKAEKNASKSSPPKALKGNRRGDTETLLASADPSTIDYDPVHPWPEPPQDYDDIGPEILQSPDAQQAQHPPGSVGLWIHSLYRAVVMISQIDTAYARKAEAAFWPFLARYLTRVEYEAKMRLLGEQLAREQERTTLAKAATSTQAEKEKILARASELFDHVHLSLKDEGSALEADQFQAALEVFRTSGGFRFKPKPTPDPTDGGDENAEIADRVGPGVYAGQRSRETFMREIGEELDGVDGQHEILSHPPFGDKDWGEVEAHERRVKAWGKRKADGA